MLVIFQRGLVSRYLLAAVLIIAVCIAILPVCAQSSSATESTAPPVSLTISTLTDNLYPAQPLRLITKATATEDFQGSLSFGRLQIVVRTAGEKRITAIENFSTKVFLDYLPPATGQVYAKDHSIAAEYLLLYDFRNQSFLLPHPGTYEIHASLSIFVGTDLCNYKPVQVKSNALAIKVMAPKGDEAMAAALWQQKPPLEGPMVDLRNAQTLIATYPHTSYAQYARLYLGSDRFFGIPTGIPDNLPDSTRVSLLKALIDNNPPRQIADLALWNLAEFLYLRGNYSESHRYVEQLRVLPAATKISRMEAERLLKDLDSRKP
jgi:hypothetical protein